MLVYVDNGYDGRTMDRPAMNQLNTDIKEGKIHAIIASNLSRIGREFLEVYGWLYNIYRQGITFLAVLDGIEDDSFFDNNVLFQLYCNNFTSLPSE